MDKFWGLVFPISLYILIISAGLYITRDLTQMDFINRIREYKATDNLRRRIMNHTRRSDFIPTIAVFDNTSENIVKSMGMQPLFSDNASYIISHVQGILIGPFQYMKLDTHEGYQIHKYTERAMLIKELVNKLGNRNSSEFIPIVGYGDAMNFLIMLYSKNPQLLIKSESSNVFKWESKQILSYLMEHYNGTCILDNSTIEDHIGVKNFTDSIELNGEFKIVASYNGEYVAIIEHRFVPVFGTTILKDTQLMQIMLDLAYHSSK